MSEPATTGQRSAEKAGAGKLYIENNLLRVAGALFCHDQKRAATRTSEIRLNPETAEKRTIIRPDPQIGQPGPLERI